jgi:hypothetical protein
MENKITSPMDVSKGIQFDFTIEGITEGQAKNLLDVIIEQVKVINPEWDNVFAGGYVSVAHVEELEKDRLGYWNDVSYSDLLDMVDDDISLDDLEEWEDELSDYPNDREEWGYDD